MTTATQTSTSPISAAFGNPIARLAQAEATLINSIDALAGSIDTIGTDALDRAMARLEDATRACHGRLGAAMAGLQHKAAELASAMGSVATEILADLSTDAWLDRSGTAHHETPSLPEPSANGRANGHVPTNRLTEEPALPVAPSTSEENIDLAADLPPVEEPVPTAEASHSAADAVPTPATTLSMPTDAVPTPTEEATTSQSDVAFDTTIPTQPALEVSASEEAVQSADTPAPAPKGKARRRKS